MLCRATGWCKKASQHPGLGIGSRGILGPVLDLKSSSMQMACGGKQRHVEEFRSKKRGTFQAELSMFRSFFRSQRACRNNSFTNYLYITEKGLPNTTGRTTAKSKGSDTQRLRKSHHFGQGAHIEQEQEQDPVGWVFT